MLHFLIVDKSLNPHLLIHFHFQNLIGSFFFFSDISPFTSGIHVYRSAFSLTCVWHYYANIPAELLQAYFIFRVLSNYTNRIFYQSPITNGFTILNGLKLNTSYKVDIAVGFPSSKLLGPVLQPIQSITQSTQDTSKGLCCAR